jgi:parvulin-like peptidyl-prolyl isomerase
MLIANPIYDVVFKYMMEDARVAKIFLSAVMGKEVMDIEFLPQELSGTTTDGKKLPSLGLTVYRLDFSARIKTESGKEEVVIIEVQKTKMYNEVVRFRRYLGKQYMNERNSYEQVDSSGRLMKLGMPIYAVYFLGELLPGFEEFPVVHVKNMLIDHTSKQMIEEHPMFIKSLYHEGTIVSIPALKGKRREDLEILLSIFDQSKTTEDMHIINVKEQDFPERFRPIIRRLQKAVEVKEVREVMDMEDDFVKEIMEYEDRVKLRDLLIEEERRQKEEERRLKRRKLKRNKGSYKVIVA